MKHIHLISVEKAWQAEAQGACRQKLEQKFLHQNFQNLLTVYWLYFFELAGAILMTDRISLFGQSDKL